MDDAETQELLISKSWSLWKSVWPFVLQVIDPDRGVDYDHGLIPPNAIRSHFVEIALPLDPPAKASKVSLGVHLDQQM